MIHLETHATRGLLLLPLVQVDCLLVELALTASWLVTWGRVALLILVKLEMPVCPLPTWLRFLEPRNSSSAQPLQMPIPLV